MTTISLNSLRKSASSKRSGRSWAKVFMATSGLRISCDMLAARSVQKAARSSSACFSRIVSSAVRSCRQRRPQGPALVAQAARLDRKRAPRVIVDPLARRQFAFRIERVAQEAGQPGSDSFHRFIQDVRARSSEKLFRRRIKPAHDSVLIDGHDAGRNRFEKRFGQRLLQRDFLVKQGVLQHGRDLFRQQHQFFEIALIEWLTGDAMPEK